MTKIILIPAEIFLILLIFFFWAFLVFSILEKEKRAALRSSFFLLFLIILALIFIYLPPFAQNTAASILLFLIAVFILAIILSPSPKKTLQISGYQSRIDERDVVFARFDLKEGSKRFEEYYRNNPKYKAIDDEIRKLPDILSEKHMAKSPWEFSLAQAEFDFLEHQLTEVDGKISEPMNKDSSDNNTRKIKSFLKYLGADLSGICLMEDKYLYSHVGRGPEEYGKKITLDHKYGIVFAVEMDLDLVASAPLPPVVVETGKKYVEAARIGIILASVIRKIGYPARAHIAGSNYQAILPPLAWKAGLGEIGRMGILITPAFGPRVRLGLVTTDLPLIPDKPQSFGVQDFCRKCLKCAHCCPAKAIPSGDKTEENGVLKWVINREECYRFWRIAGTDCATCLFVCPYSKANNIFHQPIRKIIEKSNFAQTISIAADDLFYGKNPLRRKSPL